jgi:outer membrane receptor for ferrienterochelin and colicins
MRPSALLVLALSWAPALLLAQGEPAPGDVIVTVRSESGTPLADAEVRTETQQALSDPQGIARLALPAGPHRLTVARIGFEPATISVEVPAGREVSATVTLEPVPYRLDSVTVLSTRIGTNIEDTPLKVDVIATEDVSEKVQSAPGSAVAIFREPNALLKVQTTAPALGGVAVRIQGLRGRYTQILADGLPLFTKLQ